MTAADLVGTWRLERWETRYDDGRVIFPMGEDARGFLIYAPDGWMSAVLSRSDRLAFRTGEALTAATEEKCAGWDSYFSYVGRYRIEGECVVHHIEACQYPNWLGDDQVRRMDLQGGRLLLETMPQPSRRGQQRSILAWRRAEGR